MDKVDHGTPTIREVLEEIKLRKIILPSIQRKFVWDQKKIVKLFGISLSSLATILIGLADANNICSSLETPL